MGFAGTVSDETATGPAGLATLAGEELSDGPRVPLLPGNWVIESQ
jgi:hypothetical protein